ncbi:MAG: D-2-hydroxyacid dehydrogenase [Bacteroidia bacterium]|nr:D-2-hydroxyacid dehydrogenase [Bacteroidia bacterium]
MLKILANDGVHPTGIKLLEDAGHTVITEKIAQDDLPNQLPNFDVILVRSATKVRKDLIDQCPNLKLIGRGGVGLDNIDVDYAKSKGIHVINTPAASSRAVAELTFGHMLSLARFLHVSNRKMPVSGNSEFGKLKKSFAKGFQISGKKLGIIGFGRIGQETAKLGIGIGMHVLPVDPYIAKATLDLNFPNNPSQNLQMEIASVPMETMLAEADILSIHVPFAGGQPIIGAKEMDKMKEGVVIVNAARGGVVDEQALLTNLESGKIKAAALDVFVGEPVPNQALLDHPQISVSPHIGAATAEAQENIGIELASQITDLLG